MAQQDWEYRREIALPFFLTLDDGPELQCEEILRILPGRRLVCRASQGDKPVLVKLFLGGNRQREALEDALGVKAMMAAGIATPALRLESSVRDKGYPVLVFDYIAAAQSFREAWTQAGEAQSSRLLENLLLLVARQHQAGLWQRDFHLNNFIFDAQGQLYAIDGGDFIVGATPLSKRASVANLGVLFGHLPRRVLHDAPQLLNVYLEQRGWKGSAQLLRQVSTAADAFRHRRARRISRKGFRSCSEFVVWKSRNLRVCQRRDFSRSILEKWLEDTALAPGVEEQVLKPGNSQTVWISQIGGHEVVIKRYNLKNGLHALRRMFTRSRASRSWENALSLRAYHIATPQPLAMIEERRFGFRQRAWLLTARAAGIGANRYIPEHSDDQTLARLASVVRAFGENGLVHGDMKATNFMMTDESVEVIDLDSMFRPLTGPVLRARVAKDHRRFLQNWEDAGLRKRFAELLKRGFG
jgi:tRNA A-37 threonylcarbamoyl transferase component Bud32